MCRTNSLPPDSDTQGPDDFVAALADLAAMPQHLATIVAAIPSAQWKTRPAAGGFSLVEHVCHLRDIEIEGYRARIERMLAEATPYLPDLDGDRLARERNYPSQDLRAAERAFAETRATLVLQLAALMPEERRRAGMLEGVGRITLADLAATMRQHDREHLAELAALRTEVAGGSD
jgi:hypothetical protein